jgi:adenylate cyclase
MFVHAALVVVLIGWGFGGQYYLLAIMVFVFAFPYSRRFQVTVLVATIALFAAGSYYTQQVLPPFEVPGAALAALNIANIATVFCIISLAVAYRIAVTQRAEAALATEHARSERLLTNVMPVPIAQRLKAREELIADGVDATSVLFADIVGFTSLSARLSPDEVVRLLDGVFTRLDTLVDQFGLEKVKTIKYPHLARTTPKCSHASPWPPATSWPSTT